MIDTLKFARSFQEAGFEARQAEALAVALAEASSQGREDLATKADLRQLENKLETKIDAVEARMGAGFSQLRLEMKASIADVKADMVRWLIGSQAVLLMALVALSNFTKAFN
ncbi:MAG TPA: hypothetical protein VIG90_04820 [Pedomonas sp.]|uniref:hypothetical protein n=1 Tax=Pedomonas sp. TaxID=2976421 RepID=UPI002F3FB8B4